MEEVDDAKLFNRKESDHTLTRPETIYKSTTIMSNKKAVKPIV